MEQEKTMSMSESTKRAMDNMAAIYREHERRLPIAAAEEEVVRAAEAWRDSTGLHYVVIAAGNLHTAVDALRAARASSGAAGRDENGCSSPVEQPIPNRQVAGSTPAPVATPSPSAMPTRTALYRDLFDFMKRRFDMLPDDLGTFGIELDSIIMTHVARIERERDTWKTNTKTALKYCQRYEEERDAATTEAAKLRAELDTERMAREESDDLRRQSAHESSGVTGEVLWNTIRDLLPEGVSFVVQWRRPHAELSDNDKALLARAADRLVRSAPPSAAIDVEACLEEIMAEPNNWADRDHIRNTLRKQLRASPRAPGVAQPAERAGMTEPPADQPAQNFEMLSSLLAPHAAAKTWKPVTAEELDLLSCGGLRRWTEIADALNAARKDG